MDSTKPKKSIEKMNVPELRKELKRRKLRITGSKAVQLARLREDDKLQIQKKKEEHKAKERRKVKVFDVNRKLIAHLSPTDFMARKQELIDKGGHVYRSGLDRQDNFFIPQQTDTDSEFSWSEEEDSEGKRVGETDAEMQARQLKEYGDWFDDENKRIEKELLDEEEEKIRKRKEAGIFGVYRPSVPTPYRSSSTSGDSLNDMFQQSFEMTYARTRGFETDDDDTDEEDEEKEDTDDDDY